MRVTLALLLVAAAAQATPPTQESLARTHYAAGEQEYARGRWREALREFQAGYELSPRPEFLINFAQVYRKLGDYERAIAECERFLATAPAAPLAAQAHRLLSQLREEQARAPRAPAAPPPDMAAPSPPDLAAPPRQPLPRPPLPPAPTPIATTPAPTVVVSHAPPHRRRWVAPVVAVSVVAVAAAVAGVVLGVTLGERDTFPHPAGGTVDFR